MFGTYPVIDKDDFKDIAIKMKQFASENIIPDYDEFVAKVSEPTKNIESFSCGDAICSHGHELNENIAKFNKCLCMEGHVVQVIYFEFMLEDKRMRHLNIVDNVKNDLTDDFIDIIAKEFFNLDRPVTTIPTPAYVFLGVQKI